MNIKLQTFTGNILGLFLAMQLTDVSAKPIEPKPSDIVASWPIYSVMESNGANLQKVRFHLDQAQYPGSSNAHYILANQALNDLPSHLLQTSEYFYLRARIAQHEHNFDKALKDLHQAINLQHNYPSAWLLKANLHLIQQQSEAALNACKQLIGNSSLLIATGCSLEVSSYQEGNLTDRYKLLKRQFSTEYFAASPSQNDSDLATQFWFEQLAADMALRLERFDEALTWLSNGKLGDKPLSYVVLWADIQIARGEYAATIEALQPIVQSSAFKDDALLIRLAIAQKQQSSAITSVEATDWISLSKERVEQRIAREDDFHAADIARFYLYVEPQPALALKWAQRNFKQAKMHEDLILLQQARAQYEQADQVQLAEGVGK